MRGISTQETRLLIDSLKLHYEIEILDDGLFFKSCYFYIVQLKIKAEKTVKFNFPDDIILAISDDERKNWTQLTINSETPDILKAKYNQKIVQKVYEHKDKIFYFDPTRVDSLLKYQVEDYYQSVFTCDSIKLLAYLADALINKATFITKTSREEFFQEIISTSRKLKKAIDEGLKANYSFGKIEKRVTDNNKLFYIIDGQLSLKTNKKSLNKTEALLAISENKGENWKFTAFDSTDTENLNQILSSRYSKEIVDKLIR